MKDNTDIKPIYLTSSQRTTLIVYILMTTKYREDEIKTWHELTAAINNDGTPKYIHAEGNAKFCEKMHEDLDVIIKTIEGES